MDMVEQKLFGKTYINGEKTAKNGINDTGVNQMNFKFNKSLVHLGLNKMAHILQGHFKMHFDKGNWYSNYAAICSLWIHWHKISVGWGNGLAPNRLTITWTIGY